MVLKRDFLKRLNNVIIILVIVFLAAISVYFYVSVNSEVNAIRISLASIRDFMTGGENIWVSIRDSVSGLYTLFITQLLTFMIAIVALLSVFWYTSKRYLVEKKNALIDSLTQLYNKKAILFHLKQELMRSERYGHPTTVAILDIDFFKKYNDSNGHVAGDKLLKKFARILQNFVRKYDEVGRFGGEEFVIVFPETQIDEAFKVCERFRKEIEETRFYGAKNMPNKKVTVSIGIAEIKGKKRMKKETLLHKADESLYRAKNTGRNQVMFEK